MTLVYVAVGSNIEPEKNIAASLVKLASAIALEAISPFYWSEPVGPAGKDPFLNGVVAINTSLPPLDLKTQILQNIEASQGRIRTANKYAPRVIDLDILLYEEKVDPELHVYEHLARPLYDLAPTLILEGQPLAQVPPLCHESTLKVNPTFSSYLLNLLKLG